MDNNMLQNITSKINTPGYVFDLNRLKEQIDCMRENLGEKILICYAMKANPFITEPMSKIVNRLEVCSPGEYAICTRSNIPPEMIVVSGVNKTKDSIDAILDYSKGKGIYTIESKSHYNILTECAKERGYKLDVIIRLSSGNQFGVDKELLESILNSIIEEKVLNIVGIHFYSGTQKKIDKVKTEIEELNEYAKYLKEKYSIKYLELEYGPGMLVAYFQGGKVKEDAEQLKELKEVLDKCDMYDTISLEFGRFIAAKCGYYATKIVDVKNTEDAGYLIVDGGIHQINYFGQIMGMKKPYMKYISRETGEVIDLKEVNSSNKWNICGSLCTVNDVIVREVPIEEPKPGDIIVFEITGAYSVTEGMAMFLSRELPEVNLLDYDGKVQCLRNIVETNNFNSKMEEMKWKN